MNITWKGKGNDQIWRHSGESCSQKLWRKTLARPRDVEAATSARPGWNPCLSSIPTHYGQNPSVVDSPSGPIAQHPPQGGFRYNSSARSKLKIDLHDLSSSNKRLKSMHNLNCVEGNPTSTVLYDIRRNPSNRPVARGMRSPLYGCFHTVLYRVLSARVLG